MHSKEQSTAIVRFFREDTMSPHCIQLQSSPLYQAALLPIKCYALLPFQHLQNCLKSCLEHLCCTTCLIFVTVSISSSTEWPPVTTNRYRKWLSNRSKHPPVLRGGSTSFGWFTPSKRKLSCMPMSPIENCIASSIRGFVKTDSP